MTDERGPNRLDLGRREPVLHLTDIGGFDVTDAAPLREGGLLVLERRFRWSKASRCPQAPET